MRVWENLNLFISPFFPNLFFSFFSLSVSAVHSSQHHVVVVVVGPVDVGVVVDAETPALTPLVVPV